MFFFSKYACSDDFKMPNQRKLKKNPPQSGKCHDIKIYMLLAIFLLNFNPLLQFFVFLEGTMVFNLEVVIDSPVFPHQKGQF